MGYKRLDIESAIAEIARLEQEREEGIVVNVAEKLWAGCAPDDAYHEDIRAAHDMPVFHSNYRVGMVDVIFPGDLCVCIVSKTCGNAAGRVFRAAEKYLRGRGIPVVAVGSDFLLADIPNRQRYKLGSYDRVKTENGMWETTIHFSIRADPELIQDFRVERPEMTRAELDQYGVTAEELLKAIEKQF